MRLCLEPMIYPNKHTVATQENEAQYTVNLSIELI
jgi:hypothetical protein